MFASASFPRGWWFVDGCFSLDFKGRLLFSTLLDIVSLDMLDSVNLTRD